MPTRNYKQIEAHLVSWIKEQAEARGAGHLVVNLHGNIAGSAFALYLCKKTQLPTVAFIADNNFGDNAVLFAFQCNIQHTYLDVDSVVSEHINVIKKYDDKLVIDSSAVRNTIINSYITTLATSLNGLVVGTRCKAEHLFIRSFVKNDFVDILPFANLHKSQIDEFYQNCVDYGKYPAAKAIFNANPKQQDHGFDLGISFEEIEWLDQLNERTKIGPKHLQEGMLENRNDPAKNARWFGFTGRQKEIIAKVHQVEKITRHKYNPNVPVCVLPEKLL